MKKNLDSLTGLRGVAAIIVFLAHYEIYKLIPVLKNVEGFITWHNAAVDIFFVLSGFTLAYVYLDRDFDGRAFSKYLVARFARIYPLYFMSLVVATFLIPYKPFYGFDQFWSDFLRQMFLINCWAPFGNGAFFNMPSWSISVEMFCYIFVFPALVVFYGGINRVHNRYSAPALMMILMGISYLVFMKFYRSDLLAFGPHDNIHPLSYYVNIVRGIAGFMAGFLTYLSYKKKDAVYNWCTAHSDLVYIAILLLMLCHQLQFGITSHTIVVVAPFLTLACASGSGYFNRILSTKLFVHLGDLSYSIYLLHFLVIRVSTQWLHIVMSPLATIFVVYGASALSYFAFERPSRALINAVSFSSPRGRGFQYAIVTASVIASVGTTYYLNYGRFGH